VKLFTVSDNVAFINETPSNEEEEVEGDGDDDDRSFE